MVSVLKSGASVLRLIYSSGELIGAHFVDEQYALSRWVLWTEGMSQDLAYVGQHDFLKNMPNKGKTNEIRQLSLTYAYN